RSSASAAPWGQGVTGPSRAPLGPGCPSLGVATLPVSPCVTVSPTCRVPPPDINELNLPKTCEIDFSDQDDLLHFRLLICPDEGFYKGGKFVFSFKVGQGYPHDPPKVKCETMVYHPNIDLEGNVCLNILREDWKPVLTINSIIYGLQYLFLVSPAGARARLGVGAPLWLWGGPWVAPGGSGT
uniref:NEDD8-conjugating enzyme UBC12 n=1 Tax=Otus sunia TaxID=257818 RepID=A0A8C8ASA7_9STRI